VDGHHYNLNPESEKMSVALQQTDWHCLPRALGRYAAADSARPHAVVGKAVAWQGATEVG